MGESKVNKKIMLEALEALIEKKDEEIGTLCIDNNFYFSLWTELIDFIHANHGMAGIDKATAKLKREDKERLAGYIRDNYENEI